MDPAQLPNLTEEQKRSLQQETFISEILRIRTQRGSESKRWTAILFETAGGTALITVLLGGLLGTILNSCIQGNLKDREAQQAHEKSKGDLAVISYNNYLEHRQGAMERVYDLVGRSASACHTLSSRMSPENNPKLYPTKQDELIKENDDVYKKFQTMQDEWRSKRDSVGLLVSYYYEGNEDIMRCWNETKDSVTKYLDRTDQEYLTYVLEWKSRDTAKVAEQERSDYEKNIGIFTRCIEGVNDYFWKEYYPGRTANVNK